MKKGRKTIFLGVVFMAAFALWTVLVTSVDVTGAGVNGTDIGLSSLNLWFFQLTGVNLTFYTITDWLGLVPVAVCIIFGATGFVQMIKRRSLLRVDVDIMILGVYYILVIAGYLLFEMYPVNYRPILINGYMEASYPSSTTLLVLSVMPTLAEQVKRRVKNFLCKRLIRVCSFVFMVVMVSFRLVSGVHWFSDIAGGVLLSTGLYCVYKGAVTVCLSDKYKGRK